MKVHLISSGFPHFEEITSSNRKYYGFTRNIDDKVWKRYTKAIQEFKSALAALEKEVEKDNE